MIFVNRLTSHGLPYFATSKKGSVGFARYCKAIRIEIVLSWRRGHPLQYMSSLEICYIRWARFKMQEDGQKPTDTKPPRLFGLNSRAKEAVNNPVFLLF